MQKNIVISLALLSFSLFLSIPSAHAGDCSNRSQVDWHATISSATHVRVDCDDHKGPVGDSIGVASAGQVVRIVEVDRNREYFVVETDKGRGFVYKSFLKDIKESPLASSHTETPQENPHQEKGHSPKEHQAFSDLSTDHRYYHEILAVKAKGIVSGTPEGKIMPDAPINRVELAKILVEASSSDEEISKAPTHSDLYQDIEAGAWYLPYLYLAKSKGIMTGDSGRATVRPGDSANGAEVAKMIATAFDLNVRSAGPGEQWYVPYLEMLRFKGALPYDAADHQVTRGEMMFMISQILK